MELAFNFSSDSGRQAPLSSHILGEPRGVLSLTDPVKESAADREVLVRFGTGVGQGTSTTCALSPS